MSSTKDFFVVLVFIVNTLEAICGQGCRTFLPEIPDDTSVSDKSTVELTKSDLQTCQLFDKLVSIYEDLGILTPRVTSCYALKKIKRDVSPIHQFDNQRTITITFQFVENFVQTNSGGYTVSDGNGTSDSPCQSSRSPKLASMQSLSMYGYNTSEPKDNDRNKSAAVSTKLEGNENGDHSGGLSNTQKLVIATCSAVIGTFFIIAGVMRIRNYIKRWREDQASRERTYRLPLHSAGHESPEEFRRASVNSKTGLQNSPPHVVHDALYLQVSNGLPVAQNPAPKTTYEDENPVLVITAPSTTQNTPRDSDASIRYIDEENTEKNTPPSPPNDENDKAEEEEPLISTRETDDIENALSDTTPSDDAAKDDDVNQPPANENECDNLTSDTSINGDISSTENKDLVNGVHTDEACYENDDGESPPFSLNLNSGLTQSDESLGCNNPSYCYGNQAEYSFDSGYGQVAYHCPISDLDVEINDDHETLPAGYNHDNHCDENELCYENGNREETSLLQNSLADDGMDKENDDVKHIKRAPLISVPSIVLEEYNGTQETV